MKNLQIKKTIPKYLPLYILTIAIMFVMRNFSRITDSDAYIWILASTARWVSVLSGISFEYLPHEGYINRFYRFLIAPSCSGIRFMLLTFVMLIFSFLHQIKSVRKGYLWFCLSAILSYLLTIFVGGIRIVVSIYLPDVLENLGFMNGWLTPDRLHTMIGASIYFTSLCIIYPVAAAICQRVFIKSFDKLPSPSPDTASPYLFLPVIPAFWYLLTVLAIPCLGRVITKDWEGVGQYAALIFCVSLAVSTLLYLTGRFLRRKIKQKGGVSNTRSRP